MERHDAIPITTTRRAGLRPSRRQQTPTWAIRHRPLQCWVDVDAIRVLIRCANDCPSGRPPGACRGAFGSPGWRWLVERLRINPVIRAMQRRTDPLFRRPGISLDVKL